MGRWTKKRIRRRHKNKKPLSFAKRKSNVLSSIKRRGAGPDTISYLQGRLVERDIVGSACPYCGDKIALGTFSVDHILPLSRGGGHQALNLVVCCRRCNMAKGDMSSQEFSALLDTIAKFDDKGLRVLRRLIAAGGIFRR